MLFTQWQQVNNNLTTKPFKNEHKTIFYILCTHTYSLFCKYYTRKYTYNKYTEKIVDLSKYKLYKSICSILLCTLICIEKTNFLQHISSFATRIYPCIYYKVFKSTSTYTFRWLSKYHTSNDGSSLCGGFLRQTTLLAVSTHPFHC